MRIIDALRKITYRPPADVQALSDAFLAGNDPGGRALDRGVRANRQRAEKAALSLHRSQLERERGSLLSRVPGLRRLINS